MSERGILFSGMMIEAILDDHKTKTRRVVKPQPEFLQIYEHKGKVIYDASHRSWCWNGKAHGRYPDEWKPSLAAACPYGQPGDLLWVRENFRLPLDYHGKPAEAQNSRWLLEVDRPKVARDDMRYWNIGITPSIHMPRFMSRLTMELASVGIERAHDITEADALAEGIWRENVIVNSHCAGGRHTEETEDRFFYPGCPEDGFGSAVEAFEHLWIKINGQKSWNDNPWVWVLEFKVHRMNIDAFKENRA